MPNFGEFKPGGRPSAKALQAAADRLGEITPLIGKDGINVSGTPSGTTLSLQKKTDYKNEIFYAVISTNPVSPAQVGYYNAKSILGTITVNATQDINTDQLGGLAPNDDCIIVNPVECSGYGGSALSPGAMVSCKYVRTNQYGLVFGIAVSGSGVGTYGNPTTPGQVLICTAEGVAAWKIRYAGGP